MLCDPVHPALPAFTLTRSHRAWTMFHYTALSASRVLLRVGTADTKGTHHGEQRRICISADGLWMEKSRSILIRRIGTMTVEFERRGLPVPRRAGARLTFARPCSKGGLFGKNEGGAGSCQKVLMTREELITYTRAARISN